VASTAGATYHTSRDKADFCQNSAPLLRAEDEVITSRLFQKTRRIERFLSRGLSGDCSSNYVGGREEMLSISEEIDECRIVILSA
jgi:hypothetical protein